MRILDRYIAVTLLKGYGVVLLVLITIFSFLALVMELEDVGDGNYQVIDALIYSVLTLPQRILDLAPVTVLLGGLLGLGGLARGGELVAIRASGVSFSGFIWSVLRLVLILVIGLALFTQFIVPPLTQLAEVQRNNATRAHPDLVRGNSFWAPDKQQLLHVHRMWKGRVPARIELYEFDLQGKLNTFVYAERADVQDSGEWQLINVHRKIITDNAVVRQNRASMRWKSFLKNGQLEMLQLPVRSLSPGSLYQYLLYLKDTRQASNHIELIFWQKVFLPLSVGAMALLAVSFGFGSPRSPELGKRLFLGAGVGILFYLLSQIAANLGLLFGLSPLLIAAVPPLAVTGISCYLLRRVMF